MSDCSLALYCKNIRWNQQVVCLSWTKGSIYSFSHSYTIVTPWNSLTQAVLTIIQKVDLQKILILSIKDYKTHSSVPESHWSSDSLEPREVCLEKSLHVCLGFVHSSRVPDEALLEGGYKTSKRWFSQV